MDTYSFLRELADSWVLLAMFGFFASMAIWAFWPGLKHAREDARMIPFRNDEPQKSCTGQCEACACSTDLKGKFDV
jgi:cytochrome c oxidase cbb3-type subunit 4